MEPQKAKPSQAVATLATTQGNLNMVLPKQFIQIWWSYGQNKI